MGRGISYICKHCNKKEDLFFGIGFMFMEVYQETVNEIKEGKYGAEWKQLYQSREYVVVNAEPYLYYCKKCGRWEMTRCMDLYVPKDEKELKKEQFGKKTVEEWGEIPYVFGRELKDEYDILKAYNHDCPDCAEPMTCIEDEDALDELRLKCNKCGNIMEQNGMFLWD